MADILPLHNSEEASFRALKQLSAVLAEIAVAVTIEDKSSKNQKDQPVQKVINQG